MTFVTMKEKLLDYIEHADEKKISAIYTLVENEIEESEYTYDDETIAMLEKRSADMRSGKSKSFTVEESMIYIHEELKRSGL